LEAIEVLAKLPVSALRQAQDERLNPAYCAVLSIGIYTNGYPFSLEGEGWDEGDLST
jgi:hypothetical protein